MKKAFKIIKCVILGIVVLILGFLLIFTFKSLTSDGEPVSMFGYSYFNVATGSMRPEISEGDLVIVKKYDSDHYQVGMTVTYQLSKGSTPVTHRIVSRDGDTIITRGINTETNNRDDEPFNVSCIIGEVVNVIPSFYKVTNFVTSPIGIVLILAVGFCLIEGFALLEKKLVKAD